jgi:hypothetical protein
MDGRTILKLIKNVGVIVWTGSIWSRTEVEWWAFVSAVMKLPGSMKGGEFLN